MPTTPPEDAREFFAISNRFIELANEINSDYPRARISAAFLYSAARYNAFSWMKHEVMPEQTEEEAVACFCEQYRQLLRNNITAMTQEALK